jgi:hypothetical protein
MQDQVSLATSGASVGDWQLLVSKQLSSPLPKGQRDAIDEQPVKRNANRKIKFFIA